MKEEMIIDKPAKLEAARGNLHLTMRSSREDPSLVSRASVSLSVRRYEEGMALPEYARLVVLVPDLEVDENRFARKLWSILPQRKVPILLVSLVADSNYEPEAARRLINLAAVTRDFVHPVETRVMVCGNWLAALRSTVLPGDMLVCHSNQVFRRYLREPVLLEDVILTRLNMPVCVLSGVYDQFISPRPVKVVRRLIVWGLLGIILSGFFLFEVDIDHLTTGWINHVLFLMTFFFEVVMIWAWNSIRV